MSYIVSGAVPSGVQTVEGIAGNVNLDGLGIVITTAGSDIILTSAVKNLVAGTNCTIVENPIGTFTISFS